MKDEGLFAFLIDQPLLLAVIVTVLIATLGWRLQDGSPRMASILRNCGYLGMVAIGLLTVADLTRKATRSDAAVLMRTKPQLQIQGAEIVVPMQDDGHFWVRAQINDSQQDFMIDTGASYVSLTRSAARDAGISPRADIPALPMETANGTMVARIGTADRFAFGSLDLRGIEVVIAPDDGGKINVIGMNLLSQLASWHVEGRKLRMIPKPSTRALHDDSP